jgi:hypothetical protein
MFSLLLLLLSYFYYSFQIPRLIIRQSLSYDIYAPESKTIADPFCNFPECLAEHFARPLMVLTIADIGIDEANVERQLDKNLVLAERWNAMVLIDEADVFLEQRKAADIARNGLVSGA